MRVADILTVHSVFPDLVVNSRKRLLEVVSERLSLAAPGVDPHDIFDALLARERLGSTGIGHGVAIPHSRISGIEAPIGALATLKNPIDFESPDDIPVDILFILLVSEEESELHLKLLAKLAGAFRDSAFRERIRNTHHAQALRALMVDCADSIESP